MEIPKKKVGVGFGVMIKKDNMILLGHRNDDAIKADSAMHGEGTWTMPGGKLEWGESFEEGAIRETREETGILLNKVNVIALNNDKKGDAHFVTVGLYSDNFEGEAQALEPDEITEWKWFPLDALPENMFPPSKKVVENFLQHTFYIPEINK